MRRLMILALTSVVAFGASAAVACLDVEMAFDPEVAHPGDTVQFFASIANFSDDDLIVDLGITVQIEDFIVGPFHGHMPLAAGQELSHEFGLWIPPLPIGGTLTITVTATAGECTDTAVATLTVVVDEGSAPDPGGLQQIGLQVMSALGAAVPAENSITLGALKNLYR